MPLPKEDVSKSYIQTIESINEDENDMNNLNNIMIYVVESHRMGLSQREC